MQIITGIITEFHEIGNKSEYKFELRNHLCLEKYRKLIPIFPKTKNVVNIFFNNNKNNKSRVITLVQKFLWLR